MSAKCFEVVACTGTVLMEFDAVERVGELEDPIVVVKSRRSPGVGGMVLPYHC